MAGKGSAPRPVDGAKFRAGWERVFQRFFATEIQRQEENHEAFVRSGLGQGNRKAKSPRTRKARS